VVSGLFIGTAIGATGLIFNYKTGGMPLETDYGRNVFLGSISGIVLGAIAGFIVGWNNIYQFNP
jgi:hypothetical protein